MSDSISRSDAEVLITRALVASSTSENNAQSTAAALVAAEADGQRGHGFSRVLAYAAQAKAGKVRGDAVPRIERSAAAFLRVDAGHGFAFPALDVAIETLIPMAAECGIAAAGIYNSHHCGQLTRHVERLAERGCLAIMMANAPAAMAPWGGSKPVFGTNPIGFAVPNDPAPIVVDLSISRVARGKVMVAAQKGETIPDTWALDAAGNPTTDPKAALTGTMLPMGDAKGSALAMMVEIMAASLTGANHSFAASSFFDAEGQPPGVGQFLMAIDVNRATEGFAARFDALTSEMLSQPGVRLPGERRHQNRANATKHGLPIDPELHAKIAALAA